MKISVVTISFNQRRFLSKCVQSLRNQEFEELEYIVVDPGSTDGSREYISSCSDIVTKKIFESDDGPADGLNRGFALATGDILYYLNADDEVLPGAFSAVIGFFNMHRHIDVAIGNGVRIDEKGKYERALYSTEWNTRGYAVGNVNAVQQATFFTADAFRRAGGFNVANKTCWDGELLVDMALTGAKFGLIDQTLGAFRYYPQSISGSGRLQRMYREDRSRIAEKILGHKLGWKEHGERLLGKALRTLPNLRHRLMEP